MGYFILWLLFQGTSLLFNLVYFALALNPLLVIGGANLSAFLFYRMIPYFEQEKTPNWYLPAFVLYLLVCRLWNPFLFLLPGMGCFLFGKQRFLLLGILLCWQGGIENLLYLGALLGFSFIAQVSMRTLQEREQIHTSYFLVRDANAAKIREDRRLMEERDLSYRLHRRNDILKERTRIAREIHDHVGHRLTRSILQLSAYEALKPDQAPEFAAVRNNLEQAMEDIRKSVHALHEEGLCLQTELQELINNYRFCPVTLRVAYEQEPDADTHYCVLQIIREALTNTAKHSNADHVTIHFQQSRDEYRLLYRDNGTSANAPIVKGLGLISMEERVQRLQGRIYMNREGGFRIFVTLPKEEEVSNHEDHHRGQ